LRYLKCASDSWHRLFTYSLWKATKRLKQPTQLIPPIRNADQTGAGSDKEKANTFAVRLEKTFKPNELPQNEDLETEINKALKEPLQIRQPIKFCTPKEIQNIIQEDLNPRKAPGYDLITGTILKVHLTTICNALIRTGYFPVQWKVSPIIMIPKPGKPLEEASSYRPISLLPIMSKIFENPHAQEITPDTRRKPNPPAPSVWISTETLYHRTSTPTYRDHNRNFRKKQYCSAAFQHITQASDKVWHTGLLFKIRTPLPHAYCRILKSYVMDRLFQVKFKGEITTLRKT
jgi:hypothetical protein